jgi:HTH-type transcriptional regulator/antitoxin HigA
MRQIAEAFPPGEFIREEMEAREWSQLDLADILEMQPPALNQLLAGKRKVSPEIARKLGAAFDTSAELWMNLQTTYDLWREQSVESSVARRAALYSKAPVREMVRRGWIENSGSLDVLEKRVCDFLRISSIDETPEFKHAAHSSLPNTTMAQHAWLFRARQLAETLQVSNFTMAKFQDAVERLRALARDAEEVRHVPRVLADAGIRFVVVAPLPNTRIDGACFWLNERETHPVVVLSMRYDRIDWFWHWLGHELGHVKNRHSLSLDVEDDRADVERQAEEREADSFAESMLVDRKRVDDFVVRVSPLYSNAKIAGFASVAGVHPGIIFGRLHYREEIPFTHGRAFLVPVRKHLIPSALTDGWGAAPPSNL